MKESIAYSEGESATLSPLTASVETPSIEAVLQTFPLSEVPFRHGREGKISDFSKMVALHEGGHVLAALEKGYYVEEFEVVQRETSAGLAIIQIPLNDVEGMQYVAAAGSWHSHHGNDSDVAQIHKGEAAGGISVGEALTVAKNVRSHLSLHEWDIFAEIVSFMKSVKGHQIPDLLERVKLEALYEKSAGKIVELLPEVKLGYEKMRKSFGRLGREIDAHRDMVITIREEIVYETLEDGRIKKYKKVNGEPDLSTIDEYCGSCGKPEGHIKDCQYGSQKGKEIAKKPSLLPKIATVYPLPLEERIAA